MEPNNVNSIRYGNMHISQERSIENYHALQGDISYKNKKWTIKCYFPKQKIERDKLENPFSNYEVRNSFVRTAEKVLEYAEEFKLNADPELLHIRMQGDFITFGSIGKYKDDMNIEREYIKEETKKLSPLLKNPKLKNEVESAARSWIYTARQLKLARDKEFAETGFKFLDETHYDEVQLLTEKRYSRIADALVAEGIPIGQVAYIGENTEEVEEFLSREDFLKVYELPKPVEQPGFFKKLFSWGSGKDKEEKATVLATSEKPRAPSRKNTSVKEEVQENAPSVPEPAPASAPVAKPKAPARPPTPPPRNVEPKNEEPSPSHDTEQSAPEPAPAPKQSAPVAPKPKAPRSPSPAPAAATQSAPQPSRAAAPPPRKDSETPVLNSNAPKPPPRPLPTASAPPAREQSPAPAAATQSAPESGRDDLLESIRSGSGKGLRHVSPPKRGLLAEDPKVESLKKSKAYIEQQKRIAEEKKAAEEAAKKAAEEGKKTPESNKDQKSAGEDGWDG